MSKISCDVIRDLLPLYKDRVCSEKSMDLVEEHLPECEDCRRYLEAMDEELPPIKDELPRDARDFKKIANRLTLARIIPLGSFALIIAIIIMSVITNNLYWKIPGLDSRVKAEDVRVTELYLLENGNLYFTLESDVPFKIPAYTPDALPSSPSHGKGEDKVAFEKCSAFAKNILETPSFTQCSFAVPLKEHVYMEDPSLPDAEFVIRETLSICYEGKGDGKLAIWEDGQKVEDAPKKVEERVVHEKDRLENGGCGYSDGYEVLPEYEGGILTLYY